jgi:DNA repair ATPase RecN
MNVNPVEPYISNRSQDELRRLLEDRNDPIIDQFLFLMDEQINDLTMDKPTLDSLLDGINEQLGNLEEEEYAMDQLAKDNIYLEPNDLYYWADQLNALRLNLTTTIEAVIGWITGEEEKSDALYHRRKELEAEKEAAENAKKAAGKAGCAVG